MAHSTVYASATLQGNVLDVNNGGNALLLGSNTLSGTTTVSAGGMLSLDNAQALGPSSVALAGGMPDQHHQRDRGYGPHRKTTTFLPAE